MEEFNGTSLLFSAVCLASTNNPFSLSLSLSPFLLHHSNNGIGIHTYLMHAVTPISPALPGCGSSSSFRLLSRRLLIGSPEIDDAINPEYPV